MGRQRDAAALRYDVAPVHVRSSGVELSECFQQAPRPVRVPPLVHPAAAGHALPAESCQDAGRSDLQEVRTALLRRRPHGEVEADGPAGLFVEVSGVDGVAHGPQGAVESRDEGCSQRCERQPVREGPEPLQRRLHQGGVEGAVDGQGTPRYSVPVQEGHRRPYRFHGAGEHVGARPVDRGRLGAARLRDALGGRRVASHGEHASRPGVLHQQAAPGGQPQAVGQGKGARGAQGRVLAEAVSHQETGPDAVRSPEFEERHLVGEERRLGRARGQDGGLPGSVGGEQQVQEAAAVLLREQLLALLEHTSCGRRVVVQRPRHAGDCAALPGEHEGQRPQGLPGCGFPLCEGVGEVFGGARDERGPVLPVRSAERHRPGHVGA